MSVRKLDAGSVGSRLADAVPWPRSWPAVLLVTFAAFVAGTFVGPVLWQRPVSAAQRIPATPAPVAAAPAPQDESPDIRIYPQGTGGTPAAVATASGSSTASSDRAKPSVSSEETPKPKRHRRHRVHRRTTDEARPDRTGNGSPDDDVQVIYKAPRQQDNAQAPDRGQRRSRWLRGEGMGLPRFRDIQTPDRGWDGDSRP